MSDQDQVEDSQLDSRAGEYSARLLRVNLTTGKTSIEEISPAVARGSLGGCALGARYLYDEVGPDVAWSDPGNRLMLFGGPLTGTAIAGAGGFTACAKGAMTGGAASTQAQGSFGAYLRSCGLLGVIFEGACDRWSYLFIDADGKSELRDASHLVGLDTWETEDAVRSAVSAPRRQVSVACIGPAGERLVRWAAIMSDKGHAAGHNGVGAVMGSKRLKAIAVVRGRVPVPMNDRARFSEVAKRLIQPVVSAPAGIHHFGTLGGFHSNAATGALPVKNYTAGAWQVSQDKFAKFTAKYMHEHFEPKRDNPCWACSNRHCQTMTITEGPYAGTVLEESEYEQLSAFAGNLDIDEVSSAMMLGNVVDRLGLDTNEAGWVLGCAFECFEKGILTTADTGGLALNWGDADAARALLHRIAIRDGLGDVLAEGVRQAVQRIGRGAEQVGVYTRKGSTPRGHDHRARWAELFDTTVSESGALDNTFMVADLTQFGLPAKLDPFDPEALAKSEAKMKGAMQFEDSMVTCRFNSRMDVKTLSEALAAATGWDYTPAEALAAGRRAVNLMRAFNVRAGLTADLDRPSPRYGSTPPDGPAAGKSIAPHFARMVSDYYAGMGWSEDGKPLPETLDSLGLHEVSIDLWGTA